MLALIATALVVSACRSQPPPPHPTRWATAWIAAVNSRRLEYFHPMLGKPGTYEDPLTGGPRTGPALAFHLFSMWDRFPAAHYDIVRVTGDAQTVTVEWTATGLGNATKAEPLPGVFIIDVQADRIAMVRGYFDPSGLRR